MIDAWNSHRVLVEWGNLEAGPLRMAQLQRLERPAAFVPQGLRLICWGMVVEQPRYRDVKPLLTDWFVLGRGFCRQADAMRVLAFEHRLQLRIERDRWKPSVHDVESDRSPPGLALVPARIASEVLHIGLPAISNAAKRGEIDLYERRGQRLFVSVGWVMQKKYDERPKNRETSRQKCASVK